MTVSRAFSALAMLTLLAAPGCEDSAEPPTPRTPGVLLIPIDLSLEQAGQQAVAGDTLQFVSSVTVSNTVAFRSDQTPLRIEGLRNQTWIYGSQGDRPILRFQSPRNGTLITEMAFSGGSVGIDIEGSGHVRIESCRFDGSSVQVQGTGSGLTVDVTKSQMRNAGFYSLDMDGGSFLRAVNTTIDAAGDCGIRLQGSSVAFVSNCIIWRAQNFGIACLGSGDLADSSGCNDIYLSATASYTGCTEPASDFSLPPLFCDPNSGDYSIDALSPCAPANSGGCGLIGAVMPTDCDTT